MNCGQVCVSPKRIFVEDEIANTFIEGLVKKTRDLVIGNGLDEGTDIGPMVSMEQREKLKLQVEDALRKGAMIECGGKIPLSLKYGFYYEPTVLTGVTPEMSVMNEEVFGPVAAVSVLRTSMKPLLWRTGQYMVWERLSGLRTLILHAYVFATGVRDGMDK